MVQNPSNNKKVQVEGEWLKRAKEIVREHGIVDTNKITDILKEEMGLPESSGTPLKLVLLAARESAPRRVRLKPVCMIPDCGCIGEAHP